VVEVILLRRALEQEGLAGLEEWTGAGVGICEIFLLQFRRSNLS
jgi:hypothetical protein